MNTSVNVLDEMERASSRLFDAGLHGSLSLDDARAAVAELIDRAEEALHTLGYYAETMDRERGYGYSIERLANEGEEPECVSLRAAIARVKGV